MTNIRLIAFYLPQFHPIPENDVWWGKGFTEWSNVAKARPLFAGHYQPHIPADLGFYDLRVQETREAQASLARANGIEGFCYWHYWFAGKRLLERPFNEVLYSGKPDLPFCLGWANESWTGIWHGAPNRQLIQQTYPGPEDTKQHFYTVLDAFKDRRYIRVDDKPIFFIFQPSQLPDSNEFIRHWRALAKKEGIGDIYFVGNAEPGWSYFGTGFDGMVYHNPGWGLQAMLESKSLNQQYEKGTSKLRKVLSRLRGKKSNDQFSSIIEYADYIKYASMPKTNDQNIFPCVVPNWDNTPRCGLNGYVFINSSPELFRKHLQDAASATSRRSKDKRIIFIKAWNEWAEGNYLEPDTKFGHDYLRTCKDEVLGHNKA